VININKGYNPELMRKCKTLSDYASLIEKVREYEDYCSVEEAIKLASEYCIANNILKEFLEKNLSEVVNMLTAEFDMDKALEVARWEGKEEGIEEGKMEVQNYILELIEQGLSREEIKKKIEETKTLSEQ